MTTADRPRKPPRRSPRTSPPTLPPAFAEAVLRWGVPRLRDLPWRRTRNPWAVLVSEVMLQQTQVPRVIPKWQAFMSAFPTPHACAAAPLGEVLRLWHGLGYPRRARNLHAAAGAITGPFPDTLSSLLALPGVGPYTARAVLAFAFERDVAVVDTNIARVYARVCGQRLTATEVQRVADAVATRCAESGPDGRSDRSWWWNQCLMDLGATVCRPAPHCDQCPVSAMCAWYSSGLMADADPAVGSAGVSARQSRFAGSDREARGRLMAALNGGPIADTDVPAAIGRDDPVARRLVDALIAEGLIERLGRSLALPGAPQSVASAVVRQNVRR